MPRLPDLSYFAQAALAGALLVAISLALARAAVALYRRLIVVPHRYPGAWTNGDIRFFERVRISIGMALALTWVTFLVAGPAMPRSWPFGAIEALLTLVLLLLTNAWILLVIPREWGNTFVGKMRFGRAAVTILLWWTVMLGAALFAIAKSMTVAAPFVPSIQAVGFYG
jgi:hypothetical protein